MKKTMIWIFSFILFVSLLGCNTNTNDTGTTNQATTNQITDATTNQITDTTTNQITDITTLISTEDTTNPVIEQNSEMPTEYIIGSQEPVWTEFITATDNYDGDIVIKAEMVDDSEVNMYALGTFTVYFTVSDSNQNTASFDIEITIVENVNYTVLDTVYEYNFDDSNQVGNLALPNLLEGDGLYINAEGFAETGSNADGTVTYGNANAWTFVSTGYDLNIEEYVIETKVKALGHTNAGESPIFSVRIDYDWMMDIHFNFNNNSWAGVAVHNLPQGSVYSNNPEMGGLYPELNMDLNIEYTFKIVIQDSIIKDKDVLMIYVNDIKVIETEIPEVNANVRNIFGASSGSHIAINNIKTTNIDVQRDTNFYIAQEMFNFQFNDESDVDQLALPNLLEGNGYYVNSEGYAETIYMDDQTKVFGCSDSWTFNGTGYDFNVEEYVIDTKVIALAQTTDSTPSVFSVRIDYDWLMDIQFNFNNNSWSGVAVYKPDGNAYSNDELTGGLDPNLNLEMETEYHIQIAISESTDIEKDILSVYINGQKVLELEIPEVNANARFIFGASAGSHIKVDYFKANAIEIIQ